MEYSESHSLQSISTTSLTMHKLYTRLYIHSRTPQTEQGQIPTSSQDIERKPALIYLFNTGTQICHVTNEIENSDKLNQISKFAQIVRIKHIDPENFENLLRKS